MAGRTSGKGYAFFFYLVFVVYGSLVPLELRPFSLDDALQQFRQIQYLDLSVVSRADWIANILLYIPLAFLGCKWLLESGMFKHSSISATGLVAAICLVVAVGVEFTQQFFAPRTVSLNDLIAETIGTCLGVALWWLAGKRLADLWRAFQVGGRESLLAAITIYALLYFVLSLFPYDFVISLDEFSGKLVSGNFGWMVAGDVSLSLRWLVLHLAEMVAIAPLGLLLALVSPSLSFRRLFVAGVLLGLLLELLQLPLASGVSQGMSLVWRGVGLLAGAGLARLIQRLGIDLIARWVVKLTPVFALPYLVVVAALNGWRASGWLTLAEGLARLSEVNLLPFYYHYYTTETMAVMSVLSQFALYTPVGIAVWARHATLPYTPGGMFVIAPVLALLIALPVELCKAMQPGIHPDFTNLLVAATGAVVACWLGRWFELVLRGRVASQPGDRVEVRLR